MDRKGFTLLEIIISMLIFSIVVSGSFSLIVTANKFAVSSKNRLQACNQAQRVLEKLRYYCSEDPNDPAGSDIAFSVGTGHSPTEVRLGARPDIEGVVSPVWSYDVSTVSGSNCKQVDVTVSWVEP